VIAWLFFDFALWGVASVADEASKQAAVESQQRMVKVEQDRRDNQRVQSWLGGSWPATSVALVAWWLW
jgi:hypothetical protein